MWQSVQGNEIHKFWEWFGRVDEAKLCIQHYTSGNKKTSKSGVEDLTPGQKAALHIHIAPAFDPKLAADYKKLAKDTWTQANKAMHDWKLKAWRATRGVPDVRKTLKLPSAKPVLDFKETVVMPWEAAGGGGLSELATLAQPAFTKRRANAAEQANKRQRTTTMHTARSAAPAGVTEQQQHSQTPQQQSAGGRQTVNSRKRAAAAVTTDAISNHPTEAIAQPKTGGKSKKQKQSHQPTAVSAALDVPPCEGDGAESQLSSLQQRSTSTVSVYSDPGGAMEEVQTSRDVDQSAALEQHVNTHPNNGTFPQLSAAVPVLFSSSASHRASFPTTGPSHSSAPTAPAYASASPAQPSIDAQRQPETAAEIKRRLDGLARERATATDPSDMTKLEERADLNVGLLAAASNQSAAKLGREWAALVNTYKPHNNTLALPHASFSTTPATQPLPSATPTSTGPATVPRPPPSPTPSNMRTAPQPQRPPASPHLQYAQVYRPPDQPPPQSTYVQTYNTGRVGLQAASTHLQPTPQTLADPVFQQMFFQSMVTQAQLQVRQQQDAQRVLDNYQSHQIELENIRSRAVRAEINETHQRRSAISQRHTRAVLQYGGSADSSYAAQPFASTSSSPLMLPAAATQWDDRAELLPGGGRPSTLATVALQVDDNGFLSNII